MGQKSTNSSSDNFLRGWCRQVRAALDNAGELAYEAAELVEELLDLFPGDGDPESPVVDDESTAEGDPRGVPSGRIRQDAGAHPAVCGMVSQVDVVPGRQQDLPGVPRGTGSRAPVLAASRVLLPMAEVDDGS